MDTRSLKALLRTLAEFGVTLYEHDGLKLQLGDRSPQVPSSDIEGADELQLPPGTPDPRALIEKLYQRKHKKAVRA